MLGGMSDRYRDSAGRVITAAQAEQEYKKSLIVAGKPLNGPEYDAGLTEWLTTYSKITPAETRSLNVSVITFAVLLAIVIVIAAIAGIAGGGILGFILVAVIGGFMAFGLTAIVMLITTPKKRENA